MNEVWLLLIFHGHGHDKYVFDCEGLAEQKIFEYVKDNWHEVEVPYGELLFENEDPDKVVGTYFKHVEEEFYEITCEPILTE